MKAFIFIFCLDFAFAFAGLFKPVECCCKKVLVGKDGYGDAMTCPSQNLSDLMHKYSGHSCTTIIAHGVHKHNDNGLSVAYLYYDCFDDTDIEF